MNRRLFNPKLEQLTREEIKQLQWKKLKFLLEHQYARNPFYRNLFDRHKIKPDDIRHLMISGTRCENQQTRSGRRSAGQSAFRQPDMDEKGAIDRSVYDKRNLRIGTGSVRSKPSRSGIRRPNVGDGSALVRGKPGRYLLQYVARLGGTIGGSGFVDAILRASRRVEYACRHPKIRGQTENDASFQAESNHHRACLPDTVIRALYRNGH